MTFLLLLISCGSKEEDTSITDTSTETDTITVEDDCAIEDTGPGIRMDGTIQFADGTEARGNVRVQMCNEITCYVAKWGENGFCFPKGTLSSGYSYSFDTVPTASGNYATPLSFIEITDDNAVIQLDKPVVIPNFANTHDTSNSSMDADGGLSITIPENFSENTISSVSMNIEDAGLPLEFSSDKIIGLWYFGPFNTYLEDNSLSFTLSHTDLAVDTIVDIYNASYDEHHWIHVATTTITQEGILEVEKGISILSTLLIIQQ